MNARTILCPVDFSPCSDAAFKHAIDLAAANDAKLLLVHISAPPPTFVSGFAGYGAMPPYHPEPDARLEKMKDERVRIEYVHLIGLEGESIVKFAEQRECDLIVMGTHGYGGLQKFLLGSVADFVMRHAKCPVIVVKDQQESASKQATTA